MTFYTVGQCASVLYLTAAELHQRGLQPEELTREQILELAREGVSQSGYAPDAPLELESYPDKSGLLLFIHMTPPDRTVWRFFDSDALLDAVTTAAVSPSDSLYWWDDCFWLLSDPDRDPHLTEFADRINDDPLLCARLREHAAALPLRNT